MQVLSIVLSKTLEEDCVADSDTASLLFAFNYEIYTSPDADIADVLAVFENQLANGVVSSLGLLDCPESVGIIQNKILGVSMDPDDQLDTESCE